MKAICGAVCQQIFPLSEYVSFSIPNFISIWNHGTVPLFQAEFEGPRDYKPQPGCSKSDQISEPSDVKQEAALIKLIKKFLKEWFCLGRYNFRWCLFMSLLQKIIQHKMKWKFKAILKTYHVSLPVWWLEMYSCVHLNQTAGKYLTF